MVKHSWNRKEDASVPLIRPASFYQKVRWLNEERRTEKRREDLEAKQKQTLSSLLKMKILQRGPDRESSQGQKEKRLVVKTDCKAAQQEIDGFGELKAVPGTMKIHAGQAYQISQNRSL